jgi:hypothetical protein
MKTNYFIFIFFLFVGICPKSLFSQKGIFYYPDTSQTNTHIVDICERPLTGDIIILGMTRDIEFKNPKPFISIVDKNAKVKVSKYLSDNIYNLANVLIVENGFKIFGTRNAGGLSQFSCFFDNNGERISNKSVVDMTSGMVAKYKDLGNGISLRLSSRKKGDFFNIRVSRVNTMAELPLSNNPIVVSHHELVEDFIMLKDSSLLIAGKIFAADNSYISILYHTKITGDTIQSIILNKTKNYEGQHVGVSSSGQAYYAYSMVDEKNIVNTYISNISDKLELKNEKVINNFGIHKMIGLKNGNMLLAGYKTIEAGLNNTLRKARFVIINSKNEIVKTDELIQTDPPDTEMPSYEAILMPSASEFSTAIQLTDGRIALAGRVYYPVNATKSGANPRFNKPLLLLMSQDGLFR